VRALPHDFKIFWAGQGVSMIGGEISLVALPLTAVLLVGATPRDVALLIAAEHVPSTVAPLFAGLLVDRFRRRRLVMITDLVRAILILSIPALWFGGTLTMERLVLIALGLGIATVLFDVAFFALVPGFVTPSQLVTANSWLQVTKAVTQVAGPGLGGVIVQLVSAPVAFLCDGFSFLASAASLRMIRRADESPERPDHESGLLGAGRSLLLGFSLVWRTSLLRVVNLSSAAFNFFDGAALAVYALFLIRELQLRPLLYGAALAIGSVGGVVCGWLLPRLAARVSVRSLMSAAVITAGGGTLMLSSAPAGNLAAFVVLVSAFLVQAGTAAYVVTNATLRQRVVPEYMLGRVFATMRVVTRGVVPLGAAVGGALAGVMSLRVTVFAAGTGEVLVGAALALFGTVLPMRADQAEPLPAWGQSRRSGRRRDTGGTPRHRS
jgi:MFS family permease